MRVPRFASPEVLLTVLTAVTPPAWSAIAEAAAAGRDTTVALQVKGRAIQVAVPAGMSDAPEQLPKFAGLARSMAADAIAVFWPDSALAALRAGRATDEFELGSAVVGTYTGASAPSAEQLRGFYAYEWMHKEELLWSASTDHAEFDRVQQLLKEDPDGKKDLPVVVAVGSKVALEYAYVEDRAGIVFQVYSVSGRTTGGSGSGTTLRAMATVIVRERVVSLTLIRNRRATTRTLADFRREALEWVKRTLAANEAKTSVTAVQKNGTADALEQFPQEGEFVYVEELPEATRKVPPDYPEPARKEGVEGMVGVRALVGRDGRVKETRIALSIPPLDRAAADAVRKWTFKPARSKGQPVAVWVGVPVKFSLR